MVPVPMPSLPPLPIRAGVAPSYLWLPAGDWPNLLTFLQSHYPAVSSATWLARMAKGEVVDGNGVPLGPDSRYQRGARIFYYRELDNETKIPFDAPVLYRDGHIIVVDKPHFLPVIPGGRFLHETLLVRLRQQLHLQDLTPIHRLDRETAGVVIFSHNLASRGAYQSLFQQRAVEKVYHALAAPMAARTFPFTYRSRIVKGTPFFRMQEVAGEANSETRIDVLEQRSGPTPQTPRTLYQLCPVTGRTHQLRVHMAALGSPIVNDDFYPDALPCKGDDMTRPLQLLAKSIGFADPLTGQDRYFESGRDL
jgi:tRNA pseudouridine32 synthase/23S rRNA pseudouridine746 synthase